MFEGDIVAGVIVCAPAGAFDGTAGFLARAAAKAHGRRLRGGRLHRPRHPRRGARPAPQRRGRWLWDLDATRTLDADQIGPPCRPPGDGAGPADRASSLVVSSPSCCAGQRSHAGRRRDPGPHDHHVGRAGAGHHAGAEHRRRAVGGGRARRRAAAGAARPRAGGDRRRGGGLVRQSRRPEGSPSPPRGGRRRRRCPRGTRTGRRRSAGTRCRPRRCRPPRPRSSRC